MCHTCLDCCEIVTSIVWAKWALSSFVMTPPAPSSVFTGLSMSEDIAHRDFVKILSDINAGYEQLQWWPPGHHPSQQQWPSGGLCHAACHEHHWPRDSGSWLLRDQCDSVQHVSVLQRSAGQEVLSQHRWVYNLGVKWAYSTSVSHSNDLKWAQLIMCVNEIVTRALWILRKQWQWGDLWWAIWA